MVRAVARSGTFPGFQREALQFLADLAEHNERAWFQPRKAEYERLIREPFESLCVALAERFAARGLPLHSDPARSPFRIYRDVRFAKDKSPYKTAQGAQFPWLAAAQGGGRTRIGVGGYFHFEPGSIFVGGGIWHPEPAFLQAFRDRVVGDAEAVTAALEDEGFLATFGSVSGDRLARTPRGFPADHPLGELLRLKDVVFSRRLSDEEACSARLPDRVAEDLDAARPVLTLLGSIADGVAARSTSGLDRAG
jgi:uncharacterized protein (TIGR02453 family)